MGQYLRSISAMRGDKYAVRRFVTFSPLLIALIAVMWWGLGKMSEPPRYSCSVPTVEVNSGDTIYDIVRKNCRGDVSEVTTLLVKVYGTSIDTWQTIHLPVASPYRGDK